MRSSWPCVLPAVAVLLAGVAAAQENPTFVLGTPMFEWERYDPVVDGWIAFNSTVGLAEEGEIFRITFNDVWDADWPESDEPTPVYISIDATQAASPPPPPTISGVPQATGLWQILDFAPPGQNVPMDMQMYITMPLLVGPNSVSVGEGEADARVLISFVICDHPDPEANEFTVNLGDIMGVLKDYELDMPNPAPYVDAGPNQIAEAGSTILLDASRTFDAYNYGFDTATGVVRDDLTFIWEAVMAPTGVDLLSLQPVHVPDPELFYDQLYDQTPTASPFAEITLDVVGSYVFRLIVQDNVNPVPKTDTVTLTIVDDIPPNLPPVAAINGPTSSGEVGDMVTLSGAASFDPNAGDAITYFWQQTDELGNVITIDDASRLLLPLSGVNSKLLTFQATRTGTFYFRLVVSDGEFVDSADFHVTIVAAGSTQSLGETVVNGGDGANQDATGDDAYEPLTTTLPCGGAALPLTAVPLALLALRLRRH